jgi:nickel/cobalt exporter
MSMITMETIMAGYGSKRENGFVEVSVFETNVPPRFRLRFFDKSKAPVAPPEPGGIALETIRHDGGRQHFTFALEEGCLEAEAELPEPHEFEAVLTIRHGEARGDYEFALAEHHHHHEGLDVSGEGYQDAHERAHAEDIARRFTNRRVTTGQIVIFGLTGGLLPCPAALTILLVCLQLKQFTLGFTPVLCFSFGLALTMISVGAAAAWSVRHASRRIKGFDTLARRAPYLSSALLILLGLHVGFQGWSHLGR